MVIVRAWEETGVEIPAPYARHIKVLFAPDKGGVSELMFTQAILPPSGLTDSHTHDRGELIYVVSGEGICVNSSGETPITADVAMWVPAGEAHQIINTGYQPLKLATVFVPPYTAEQNYNRCLDAARAANQKQQA
jgi:mannose-6-phosphate isomerase-like protein (cupin superfamily)